MLQDTLRKSPIVPVVTLKRVEDAVPLAKALVAGGVKVIEITLRTPAGLPGIREVAAQVPEMTVGAGTISTPEEFNAAADAGAQFIVSPGLTEKLAKVALERGTPYLPGVATITEIMTAREYGFTFLKFFPAALAGGVGALKQFSSLFSDIRFCPTGGVNIDNLRDFLRVPSVVCVGGSWIAPDALIDAGNWQEITRLSQEAMDQIVVS